jgi:hypothetical protein
MSLPLQDCLVGSTFLFDPFLVSSVAHRFLGMALWLSNQFLSFLLEAGLLSLTPPFFPALDVDFLGWVLRALLGCRVDNIRFVLQKSMLPGLSRRVVWFCVAVRGLLRFRLCAYIN